MSAPGQPRRIGPDSGTLLLRTGRQGLAASVGHDLTIEVLRWSGEVVLADDPTTAMVTVTAELDSLRIRAGTGGVKPLSERDKREIGATARRLLDVDHHPTASFASERITVDDSGGGTIAGSCTIIGRQHQLRLTVVRTGESRYRATGTVVQSSYGIRPYTAFFGALKLADEVGLEVELDLGGSD
jgi:polyisoprenoid-binding protein YceI